MPSSFDFTAMRKVNMDSTWNAGNQQKTQLGSIFNANDFFNKGSHKPMPNVSGNNFVQGSNNSAKGTDNIVSGESNNLIGRNNTLVGSFNNLFGLNNTIFGSSNNAKGNNNRVKGSSNNLQGHNNTVVGN